MVQGILRDFLIAEGRAIPLVGVNVEVDVAIVMVLRVPSGLDGSFSIAEFSQKRASRSSAKNESKNAAHSKNETSRFVGMRAAELVGMV